eukprot:TRINITY_DN3196_c0_g1_i1.p1 TRINITY_DN3196_c0_g1~~TRINITY_DN3196_c0_g1_i1.p1  ORF type:complete len:418 (+),score=38.20 TRINITY_DN3196_c0_g1_i1:150-1403(+)
MMIRVRSRDGSERVTLSNPPTTTTVSQLKTLIETQLSVPVANQTLSTNQNILLSKTADDLRRFTDMSDPKTLISSLSIAHGSMVYLSYDGERSVAGRRPPVTPAGSFGRKMTMDDLMAKQIRVSRQETPHCDSVSFDRDAANSFQHYVNESLAFAVKRGGFMYGTVGDGGRVEVDFIYEPPQQGTEEDLMLLRDPDEEMIVEAIALGLGMRKLGFIFTQTVGQNKLDYTLSRKEILQAVELHAESGLKEWVTAVVKLEVNEDGGADVHFEAFQMSDSCVKLFKDGLFVRENGDGEECDPKVSRMSKDVVVGGKDTRDVDNDFFLVLVKILDHQGPLSSTFPVENRNTPVTMRALKNHLDRSKHLPFVKRISDFHLLLLLARYLDVNADVPALAVCVHAQTTIPEGYQLLIESMASAA